MLKVVAFETFFSRAFFLFDFFYIFIYLLFFLWLSTKLNELNYGGILREFNIILDFHRKKVVFVQLGVRRFISLVHLFVSFNCVNIMDHYQVEPYPLLLEELECKMFCRVIIFAQ